MEYYSSKKKWNSSIAAKWINLEKFMLSEKSDRERQILPCGI